MGEYIHPAEKFCRNMLKQFPKALDLAQKFYECQVQFSNSEEWPDWCGLPMAAVHAIITEGADLSIASSILGAIGIEHLANLTATLLWIKTKIIYRIDPDMGAALSEQDLDGNLPIDALLHLPYFCQFIEYPFVIDSVPFHGFFTWMEADKSGVPELRILFLAKAGGTVSVPIILSGGTLEDSQKALLKSAQERFDPNLLVSSSSLEAVYPSKQDIIAAINMALYLCSSEPDVPDEKYKSPKSVVRRKDSLGNATRTYTWNTGTRIGASLRKYKSTPSEQTPPDRKSSVGTSKRPHMRKAHWHHYWTGKKDGERELVLKWLPPIPVNASDDENPTVI